MANKTVFSRPTSKESHDRNAFDRSFVTNVNFSGGMLVPTFAKFCFGKSHVRLNQRSFMRTSQVTSPAFPSLPMYTDYFFVPMHQLLTNWNAFRSRTNDRASSLLGVPTRLPSFSDATLRQALNSMASQLSPYVDDAGLPQNYGAVRLLDLFNYGNNIDSVDIVNAASNAVGDNNPLLICAYHKIYYDHYRNTAYEGNNVNMYNLDRFYPTANIANDGSIAPSTVSANDLTAWLTLHYVNYRRDLFNTIYPSLNFTAMGNGFNMQYQNTIPNSILNGYVGIGGTDNPSITPRFTGSYVNVSQYSTLNPSYSISAGFSTANIRAAFALEKLLRVSAFAPQHVVDQFEARFGYRPKSDSLNESVRLGSFKNDIVIGEVTNTGENLYLGQVGGKGVGAADFEKVISYDVPEDGIIMGLTYVLPNQTYDSNFVDPINQQFMPEDWSLPEYDNLGLQPIFAKNLSIVRNGSSDTDANQLQRGNCIIGYQPRDMQYKASVSQNHGLFNYNQMLGIYTLHGRKEWLNTIGIYPTTGVSYKYFKCMPQDFDRMFVTAADGDEARDHFFGHIVCSFACIQDKPIFGIPKI